jgi:hypothetical protein
MCEEFKTTFGHQEYPCWKVKQLGGALSKHLDKWNMFTAFIQAEFSNRETANEFYDWLEMNTSCEMRRQTETIVLFK